MPLTTQKNHRHLLSVCLTSILLLSGCASQPTHEGMTPQLMDAIKKHPHTVSLEVTGGKTTESIGLPEISDVEFKQALSAAINKSKVFARIVGGNAGDYLLTVALFNVDQPLIGLSLTAKMEAGWTLKRVSDNAVVWQEAIKSEHTSTAGDALLAATRLRLATEGAAKNNIEQGLSKISKLETLKP